MLPTDEFSRSQIDRLGERLRKDNFTEADLRLLDSYRRSFAEASEHVVNEIRMRLGLAPTARPAKSTTSIADKLRRESIRLSQVQDIAGCRLTVADIFTQDEVVKQLKSLFQESTIVDRRERPSHGYRAVHLIIPYSGKLIEVQVRTSLQHLWAELSEKLSDIVDSAIKYGGGDEDAVRILSAMSDTIKAQEVKESRILRGLFMRDPQGNPDEVYLEDLKTADIMKQRTEIENLLRVIGEVLPRWKGRKDDLSD
ncbi:MAG TPA: hypothetical protein VIW64_14895 [Pyrinomonadaceae bacterium]|jgi:ppGpp synthetase/RelA/SpoT-type nucleotidyltranferase